MCTEKENIIWKEEYYYYLKWKEVCDEDDSVLVRNYLNRMKVEYVA